MSAGGLVCTLAGGAEGQRGRAANLLVDSRQSWSRCSLSDVSGAGGVRRVHGYTCDGPLQALDGGDGGSIRRHAFTSM